MNYFYLILLGAGILTGAGPTYYIVHTNNKIEIQNLELKSQTLQTVSVQASLSKLESYIGAMNVASNDFQQYLVNANTQYADINRKLSDAIKIAPLPANCRPDPGRLSILKTAVDNANATSPTSR